MPHPAPSQGSPLMPPQLLTIPRQPSLLPLPPTPNVWGVLTKPSTTSSFTTRAVYHVLSPLITYDISGQKPQCHGSENTSVQGLTTQKEKENELDRLQAPRTQNFYRQSRTSHQEPPAMGEPQQGLNNAKLKYNITTTLVFWDKKKKKSSLHCLSLNLLAPSVYPDNFLQTGTRHQS